MVKGSLAKENKGCSFERNTVKSMLMGGIYFPPVLSSGHKPKVCFSEAFLREMLRRLAPALAGSQPLSPPSAEAPRVLLHSEGSKEGLYLCLVQPKEPQCGRRQKGTPPEEADPGEEEDVWGEHRSEEGTLRGAQGKAQLQRAPSPCQGRGCRLDQGIASTRHCFVRSTLQSVCVQLLSRV